MLRKLLLVVATAKLLFTPRLCAKDVVCPPVRSIFCLDSLGDLGLQNFRIAVSKLCQLLAKVGFPLLFRRKLCQSGGPLFGVISAYLCLDQLVVNFLTFCFFLLYRLFSLLKLSFPRLIVVWCVRASECVRVCRVLRAYLSKKTNKILY